ncbi:MAG: hypothetical protein EOM12_16540 [Verrucomicrobiae bacterium]|nr:hypothetical protein [Verrucomicrobiae bacterium]
MTEFDMRHSTKILIFLALIAAIAIALLYGKSYGIRKLEVQRISGHAAELAANLGYLKRNNYRDAEHLAIMDATLDVLLEELSSLKTYFNMDATSQHRLQFVKGYRSKYIFSPNTNSYLGLAWDSSTHEAAESFLNTFTNIQDHRYPHEKN